MLFFDHKQPKLCPDCLGDLPPAPPDDGECCPSCQLPTTMATDSPIPATTEVETTEVASEETQPTTATTVSSLSEATQPTTATTVASIATQLGVTMQLILFLTAVHLSAIMFFH